MPVDTAASSYSTFYSVDYVDMAAEVSSKNTGSLTIGGANDYLLFTTQTFDSIYGLQLCNYKSIYSPVKMKCNSCPLDGQYTTDPRGNKCHRCDDLSEAYMKTNYLSTFEQNKLKALC
jgi:hypothetical protein